MKIINKILIIYSAILLVVSLAFFHFGKKLIKENKAQKNNIEVLLDSVATYKISDSLNAIHLGELQFELSEYKKYREEDAKLIKKLKADKPQTIIKTETKTEYKIITQIRDSIIYKDTIKAIDYSSKWTDLHGFINNDSIHINISNREELLLVEAIQRKKFIGIKLPVWLFGYKRKTLDIVSKNPNTTIKDIEYVNIKK